MRILIVEDEELAFNRLAGLIREIQSDIEIHGPLDSITETVKHLTVNTNYDLIFLDIQLADGKSFTIFEELKIVTPVIFTTAYDEYALQAFELNSIDYLLKPVNREKLKQAIDKLIIFSLKALFGAFCVHRRSSSDLVTRILIRLIVKMIAKRIQATADAYPNLKRLKPMSYR